MGFGPVSISPGLVTHMEVQSRNSTCLAKYSGFAELLCWLTCTVL